MSNVRSRLQRPAALIFDLGGVLVENVGFERLNALLPRPMPVEELKSRWLGSAAVRAFEVGGVFPEAFASAFLDEWALGLSPTAFLEAFASWPKGFYPGATELLANLRRNYTVACLSNSNAIHWARFGGFRDHFDASLSSHLLGCVKPDRECFGLALEACAVESDRAVFFDDSLINVRAASELGMRAFHVNGLVAVQRILAKKMAGHSGET